MMGLIIEMGACLADMWLGQQTVSSVSVLDEFVKYLNAALMICFGKLILLVDYNCSDFNAHLF